MYFIVSFVMISSCAIFGVKIEAFKYFHFNSSRCTSDVFKQLLHYTYVLTYVWLNCVPYSIDSAVKRNGCRMHDCLVLYAANLVFWISAMEKKREGEFEKGCLKSIKGERAQASRLVRFQLYIFYFAAL